MGRLAGPKGLLHQGQVLIPCMDEVCPCHGLRQVGLEHIAPIQLDGLLERLHMHP